MATTIESELDRVERKLNDPSNNVWTRAEFLRWYRDALVEMCEESGAVRRFFITDIPPRYSYSIVYPWEDAYRQSGTFYPFMAQSYDKQYWTSYRWEIEFLEGLSVSASRDLVSHQWERAYSGEVHQQYTVALPRNHDRIKRVAFDDRKLWATSMRDLDSPGNDWPQEGGEIDFWLLGAGRARSIELYQIQTSYSQEYEQLNADRGIPRQFSGARTYITDPIDIPTGYAYFSDGDVQHLSTSAISGVGHRITRVTTTATVQRYATQVWEIEQLEGESDLSTGATLPSYSWETAHDDDLSPYSFAVGNIRGITSPDRQYLLNQYNLMAPFGALREFKSSVDSLMVQEVVVPAIDLQESDTPDFLPPQLLKYMRDFVLARAFSRVGEGHRGDLGDHYMRRFKRGVKTFMMLEDSGHRARLWQREGSRRGDSIAGRTPPRVRLPSNFPRIHW